MTGLFLTLQDVVGAFGWVAVWLATLVAGVACILRGRSGAGACLGVAAILGLALQICGASVVGALGSALSFLPLDLGRLLAAFVRSLGDTVVYALVVAALLAQRPRPPRDG